MTAVEVPVAPPAPTDRMPAVLTASRRVSRQILLLLLLGALVLLVGRPLFEIVRLAFDDGAKGFSTAWNSPNFGSAMRSTIALAVGSTILALILGVALAWFSLRLPRGFGWLSVVPMLPIVIPSVAAITGWTFIFSPRVGYGNQLLRKLPWWNDLRTGPIDVFTLPWIVIITGLSLTAFVYLFVSAGLKNLNDELTDAALTSGSSTLGSFFRVTLPVLRPSIVYATAVCLLLAFGQFTAPLLLGRQVGVGVLTTEMYLYLTQSPLIDFGAAAAVAFPLTVIGILFVVGQRVLLGNQNRFVSHGGKSFRPVSRRSPLAAMILGGYGFLAALLPLIGIILVAFSPFWSGKIELGELTLKHLRTALDNDKIMSAITNSLRFSAWAMVITLPLAFIVSSVIVRSKKNPVVRAILDFVVALPLGVPAVIFGFGFLFAYNKDPFKWAGTSLVVVLVYITLMLPFATRLQLSGMIGLGTAHTDASATCGAGVFYTNLKVVIPMMRGAIGAAAALIFILLSHEFAASLLVRNINTNVMGTSVFDAYENGNYSMVAVISLVMSVVTAVGLCLALLIGGRRTLDAL